MRDLLHHGPRRYEPAATRSPSRALSEDEVAIEGVVAAYARGRLGGRRTIVKARVADDSGAITASWFNQPWLAEKLTPGTHLRLRGKLPRDGFEVKSYDIDEAKRRPISRPSTRRRRISRPPACASWSASLSPTAAGPARPAAGGARCCRLRPTRSPRVRYPTNSPRPRPARRRLAFEELLLLQPAVARRARTRMRSRRALGARPSSLARYREALPFEADRAPGGGDRRRSAT